jgi:hypothetical protein
MNYTYVYRVYLNKSNRWVYILLCISIYKYPHTKWIIRKDKLIHANIHRQRINHFALLDNSVIEAVCQFLHLRFFSLSTLCKVALQFPTTSMALVSVSLLLQSTSGLSIPANPYLLTHWDCILLTQLSLSLIQRFTSVPTCVWPILSVFFSGQRPFIISGGLGQVPALLA